MKISFLFSLLMVIHNRLLRVHVPFILNAFPCVEVKADAFIPNYKESSSLKITLKALNATLINLRIPFTEERYIFEMEWLFTEICHL